MLTATEIAFRLFISAILAGIIGYQREACHKPAGLRTHALVGVASTLITLVSFDAIAGSDPTRIAAGTVTGIGFIGAGTIFRAKDHVMGLATAASIWAVSGVGIAVGTGYYAGTIVMSLIAFFVLALRHSTEKS